MAEDKFYRVYSYQDELETGKCIRFRHEISFDESKADLTELVALSRSELESRINESKSKETTIFQKLKGAISEWEVQGANTMLLECALEYVRTPEVKHTNNEWKKTGKNAWEISNRVYRMSYYIDERTAYDSKLKKSIPVSWAVSWSLSYNAPRQPNSNRYYYGDTQLDGQSSKKYDNKGAAQRYIQGRADFYAHLFMELSPPIPKSGKRLFSVNGHLLPDYRMEQTQPDQSVLDDLMSYLTIDDLVGKEQPAKADGPLPKGPVSKTLTGPSDVPKAKSIRGADKNKKRGHSR